MGTWKYKNNAVHLNIVLWFPNSLLWDYPFGPESITLFASVLIYPQTAIIVLVLISSFYSFYLSSLAIKLLLVVPASKIPIPSLTHYF